MILTGRYRWAEAEAPKGKKRPQTVVVQMLRPVNCYYKLQELWISEMGDREEWRDVPVGKEKRGE